MSGPQTQSDPPALGDILSDLLWPWQVEYLTSDSPWVHVVKSRNTGLTWVGLLHAVLHCLEHDSHTYFLCTTKVEKAEDELIDPIKHNVIPALKKTSIGDQLEGAELYNRKIVFPNNSEIKAASNDVEKLRGPTKASYLFDECASWETRQHERLQDSIYPIVRDRKLNPNGSLRMVSTPKPARNLYREIAESQDDKWHRIKVDIVDACEAPGYPHDDPQVFEDQCDTRDEFLQEYMCVFLDAEGNYFSRTELKNLPSWPDHRDDVEARRYAGIDIGRKNDITAIVITNEWEYDGQQWVAVERVYRMENVPFRVQKMEIKTLIERHDLRGVCLDETAHPSMVEDIVEYFASPEADWSGEDVKGMTGDRKRKRDHTHRLQRLIEEKAFVPEALEALDWSGRGWQSSKHLDVVIDDLARVEESTTSTGKLQYDAPRDDSGHADTYSALELALTAKAETESKYLGSFG